MIYVTGDTHIPLDVDRLLNGFVGEDKLNKRDYLIICGDFGGVWNKNDQVRNRIMDKLNNKKYTTLFIDGNHENFDLLNSFNVVKWRGGKIHVVRDSIFHLMRGQVYTINHRKIFTMGGGASRDKNMRIEGVSWWKEEMPNSTEYREALLNLFSVHNKVDYIFTHVPPLSIAEMYYKTDYEFILNNFLEGLKKNIEYTNWFFGHVHIDKKIDKKHIAVFNNIYKLP